MSTLSHPPPIHSNPFASRYVRPGALAFQPVSSVLGQTAILDVHQQSDFAGNFITRLREVRCGAIVGDHGTGKSTLLRELAAHLDNEMPGGAWVQLTQSERVSERLDNLRTIARVQRTVAPGGVLVIDGAEQVPVLFRRWIARKCRGSRQFALVTSHHEIAGFETLYRTELSPALIGGLLNELLSPENGEVPLGLRSHLQHHLRSVNLDDVRNLRDLWSELYEVAEGPWAGAHGYNMPPLCGY